jgi:hypothetical protein
MMQLSSEDIIELKNTLGVCRMVDIDSVVLGAGMARAASASKKVAILTESKVQLPDGVLLGVGRVSELLKRLELEVFGSELAVEYKLSRKGDELAALTLQAGKTKALFRCSSPSVMVYPKQNTDTDCVVIESSKAEITSLIRAVKTYSAEKVIIKIEKTGQVRVECADATNDSFSTELVHQASFVDEASSLFFTYSAPYFVMVLDAAVKDVEKDFGFAIGQGGTLTTIIRDLAVLLMPEVNEEE